MELGTLLARASIVGLLCLQAIVIGCGSDPDPPPPPPPPPPSEASPPPPPPPPPPSETTAAAGTEDDAPTASVQPTLGTGALAAPRVEAASWTAQEAADEVYAGLTFNNGVQHDPNYAYCEGDPDFATTSGFTEFACYVQVPGVTPYNIQLSVTGAGEASFEFDSYAE